MADKTSVIDPRLPPLPNDNRISVRCSRGVVVVAVRGRRSPATVDLLCWGVALFIGAAGALEWTVARYRAIAYLSSPVVAVSMLVLVVFCFVGARWTVQSIRKMRGVTFVGITGRHLIVRSFRRRERFRVERDRVSDVFVSSANRGWGSPPWPRVTLRLKDKSFVKLFNGAHPADLLWMTEALRQRLALASGRTRRAQWIANHAHFRGTMGSDLFEFMPAPAERVRIHVPRSVRQGDTAELDITADEISIRACYGSCRLPCDQIYAMRIEGGGESGPEYLRIFLADLQPAGTLSNVRRDRLAAIMDLLREALDLGS